MRRLIIAASSAAFLVASSAVALAEQATGAIASIDPRANTVTLENGETFSLPESFDAATLTVGEKVKITYTMGDGGRLRVSGVERSS
jgi:Protein of unknown function (DUF1344)